MSKNRKHTPRDLRQMQSLPLEVKVQMTQRRVREWYDYWEGNVYLSFSGGKDSTVLKHIIDQMYDDIPSVFVNTGLEFPEIRRFVRDVKGGKYSCFNPDVEVLRPEMRFDDVLRMYGYPVIGKAVAHSVSIARRNPNGKVARKVFNPDTKGRFAFNKWSHLIDAPFLVSDKCCEITKKKPSELYARRTNRKVIVATMAEESSLRYASWLSNGCNTFEDGKIASRPMSFWTEQDVLKYLRQYNVPYCSVYGDIQAKGATSTGCNNESENGVDLETTGYSRTGCVYCLFGCHLESEPNRIQQLKATHPRQYDYCLNGGEYVEGLWQPSKEGLGLRKVMDYIGIPYEGGANTHEQKP